MTPILPWNESLHHTRYGTKGAADATDHKPEAEAFLTAYQQVLTDYQDAATAAHRGDLAGFRAAFDRVAPGGNPTGPDAQALDRAAAALPFSACGKGSGL